MHAKRPISTRDVEMLEFKDKKVSEMVSEPLTKKQILNTNIKHLET